MLHSLCGILTFLAGQRGEYVAHENSCQEGQEGMLSSFAAAGDGTMNRRNNPVRIMIRTERSGPGEELVANKG